METYEYRLLLSSIYSNIKYYKDMILNSTNNKERSYYENLLDREIRIFKYWRFQIRDEYKLNN